MAAQRLLQSQMEAAQQQTGVALPAFYNPQAINPMRIAQQMQKRKLLWSKKVGLPFLFLRCPDSSTISLLR